MSGPGHSLYKTSTAIPKDRVLSVNVTALMTVLQDGGWWDRTVPA